MNVFQVTILIILFISCSFQDNSRSPQSLEENAIEDHVEIVSSHRDNQGKIICDTSKVLIDELDQIPDQKLIKLLEQDIEDYKLIYLNNKSKMTVHERKLHRKMMNDLDILIKSNRPRTMIQKTLVNACEISRISGGVAVRATALTASAITTAIGIPFRFVYRFGRGVIKGVPEKNKAEGVYAEYGFKIGQAVPSLLAYRGIRLVILSGANPALIPIYLIPLIDYFSQKICVEINEKNENEVKFCNKLSKIKNLGHHSVDKSDDYGASFNRFLNKKFNFRSEEKVNQFLCSRDIRNQKKVAMRILNQITPELKNEFPGIIKILPLPPAPNTCVKFGIIVKNQDSLVQISQELGPILDGIEVLYEVEARENFSHFYKPVSQEDENDICIILHDQKNRLNPEYKKKQQNDFLTLFLNPSKVTPISEHFYKTPSNLLRAMPLEKNLNLKNFIFIIGPSREERMIWKDLMPAYEDLQKELKKLNKVLRRLANEPNVESCQERLIFDPFEIHEYLSLKKQLEQFQLSDLINQNKILSKQVKQATKGLLGFEKSKLHWEIIPVNTMTEIQTALKRDDVANILIIAHAKENGKIVDSQNDEIPSTFFKWINPSLQSINFYSCHSMKTNSLYGFKELFTSEPTYQSTRYSYNLDDNEFLGNSEYAPVMALADYLSRLDRKLYLATLDNQRFQSLNRHQLITYKSPDYCHLQFKKFDVQKGTIGLTLNRKFVGLKKEHSEQVNFRFPCEWLKDSNTLMLENRKFNEISSFSNLDLDLFISGPGWGKRPLEIKNFTGSDGQWISTKITF